MPVSKEQGSLTSCAHGGRWSWQGAFIYFVDIGDFLFLQHLASHSCHSFLPSFLSLFSSANTAFKQRNQKEVLNLQCLLPSGVSCPCCPGQTGACGIPCTWKGDLKRAGQELDPVQLILTCQGQDSWFVNDWGVSCRNERGREKVG